MSPCFNPKSLALAGFLLAAPAFAADAPAGASGKSSAAVSTSEVATSAVSFVQPVMDPYSRSNWMAIQVDFYVNVKAPAAFINDLSVTLKLAWERPGAQPPVDLVLESTVKLVGAAGGKKNTVFFFVPPETLGRSAKGIPYDAGHPPGYYLVEYKIGDDTVPLARNDYSTMLNPESAKNFSTMADGSASKGLLFSESTAPAYILAMALQRIGGNNFPTFYPAGADAGH